MNYRHTLMSVAVCATLACASAPAFAGEFYTAKNPIKGQYIVVLKDGTASLAGEQGIASSVASVSTVASDMATKHRAKVVRSYRSALRGFVANADDKALAKLLADPRVAYVQEDGIVSIAATQTNATWGLDRVDQRDLPLNQTYNYDTTASGVHAYVIDTGLLSTHSQFSNRVGNGWSAISDGRGTGDCNGHGTHVAGTVGGSTYGVAKGVTIHPVRVLGCDGTGSFSGIVDGIDWVASNHTKPAVANMSLGGDANQATDDAVARLVNAGVTVVVAAGNAGQNACNYSPARASVAITVGASDSQDRRSLYTSPQASNYGSCVDLFAPGSNIVSAGISSTTATATMGGTSMASPPVAGAAALYLANNPSATPSQVTQAILNNTTPNKISDTVGSPNKLLYTIFGGTTPPPGSYSISGTITTSAGAGISGVTVSNGTITATTNSSGAYTLTGLANATYTLTPSLTGYTFSPASRSVTVNGANVTGVNFTGAPSGGGGGQTYSNANNVTIYDNYWVTSPITVSGRTGNGSATTPVAVDIKHTFRGDLRVELVAPDGSAYLLKNFNSTDSADNVIQTYTVNLSSEALNGTWYLRVTDNWVNDTGYIDSWSMTF